MPFNTCAVLVSLSQKDYSKTEEGAKRRNRDDAIYRSLETEQDHERQTM